jgi:hypothetical protein
MPGRRDVLYCVVVFLACRIAFSLVGVLGITSTTEPPSALDVSPGPHGPVVGTGTEVPATPGLHNVVDASLRWDATWFLAIAEDGYDDAASGAFFPGYVSATRAVDLITPLGTVGSALLVSNGSFLLALLLLFRLTVDEFDRDVARRSIVLLAFFPTSFFFLAPYSESTYLLCCVLALAAARHGRWGMSGVSGAVAAVVRNVGVTLAPALLVERYEQRREVRSWSSWIAAAGPILGFLAVVGWFALFDDVVSPVRAQDVWHRQAAFPLVSLGRGIGIGARAIGDASWIPEAIDVLIVMPPLVLLLACWRRLPSASYGIFVAFGFLLPLTFTVDARPLLSLPRFVITLFPLAWLAALVTDSRFRFGLVLGVSFAGWIAASLAFVNWRFVA